MTDRNAIIAALTHAILGKTATQAAAAALELVGPKPLVWESPCEDNDQCHIARTPSGDYCVAVNGGQYQAWMDTLIEPFEVRIGDHVWDLEAAKAAAQAHADAAHWANTKIGGK